jgi:hypothetical protein
MVKHIVLWKLKETAHGQPAAENARVIKQKLECLSGQIPGLIRIEVGIDFAGGGDASTLALYSEFTNREALAAYQDHPAHKAVLPFIAEARSERRVVDYEI